MADKEIYIYLKNTLELSLYEEIQLQDIAEIWTVGVEETKFDHINFGNLGEREYFMITALDILKRLKEEFPDCQVQIMGSSEIWVTKEKIPKSAKPSNFIKVCLVALLLFVGGAMAIMNYHADVNMPEVHKKVYYLITGIETDNTLMVSVPYSLGIGIGIAVFFNHFPLGRKDNPNPLELEMFTYLHDIDEYKRNNYLHGGTEK